MNNVQFTIKKYLGSTVFFRGRTNHPASLVTVVASRPSAPTKPSKVSTFTRIVEIGIEKPRNCPRFWTPDSLLNLNSVNSHRDREGRGRDTPNCRPFWAIGSSWSSKSSNSHRDRVLVCVLRMPSEGPKTQGYNPKCTNLKSFHLNPTLYTPNPRRETLNPRTPKP